MVLCMTRDHWAAVAVPDASSQNAEARWLRANACATSMLGDLVLYLVKQLLLDDRIVLALIGLSLVRDQPKVNAI